MILDLSSLRSAIAQAEEALAYCRSDLAKADPRLAPHLRAAAIQAFAFTYELAVKTLRRYLGEIDANPAEIEGLTFNDLIRRGYAVGLLRAELADWKEFRRSRGTTSQSFDAARARAIYEGIPEFVAEAKFLAEQIQRNGLQPPE